MRKIKLGEVHNTTNYGKLIVVEVLKRGRVIVEFMDTGYTTNLSVHNIRKGQAKDLLKPAVYGVGFMGGTKFKGTVSGKKTKEYNAWLNMLCRCYSEHYHKNHPTYKYCTVSPEWHNYQNFAEWYSENIAGLCENEVYQVDKDIMSGKFCKEYSRDNCCLVPNYINSLLVFCDKKRGNLPVGVTLNKRDGSFVTKISIYGKRTHIGVSTSAKDAFNLYKKFKEDLIRQSGQKAYKEGKITLAVKEALFSYKIHIDL